MKHRLNKPNFLVIGAQKSATTSLCHLLGQHPDVFISDPKEPHFFSVGANYETRGWPWYQSLFERVTSETAVGEGSTSYTMHMHRPRAAGRIATDLPEAKLIYIVRHPLDRIASNYLHLRFTRRTKATLSEVLATHPYVIDTSCYWKQICLYRSAFPPEQILVLFFEDFKRDPSRVVKSCFRFLGVDDHVTVANSDQPQNASLGTRHYTALGAGLRRLAELSGLGRPLPNRLKRIALRLTTTSLKEKPTWDEESRGLALRSVKPDAERFLAEYGHPEEDWRL